MQTPRLNFRAEATDKSSNVFITIIVLWLANELYLPEEYADIIKYLDKQRPWQSLFVRHCKRLAQLLRNTHRPFGTQDEINFAWLYDLTHDRPSIAGPYITDPARSVDEIGSSNKLLFLSGYPSTRLLLQIGSQFNIDPAFFDTHLSFINDDITSCNLHPSHYILPSRQQMIFQTSITSIGAAPEDMRYENLARKREICASKMDQYLHELRRGTGWKAFQSVVRAMEVHDARRFSLQQNVTVLIKRSTKDVGKWLVVIWSDVGADLIQSPQGPWLDSIQAPINSHFRPITLPGPNFAMGLLPQDQASLDGEREPANLYQSATLLPRKYGTSLDQQLMASDPVYALTELFGFFCASETQYLDTVRSVLDENVASILSESVTNNGDVRAVLVFSYRGLEKRRDQITAAIDFLKGQSEPQHISNSSAVRLVIRDYGFLLGRTNELMARCDHEWSVIMSEAAVNDAQWSRDQSRSQHKFTVLASMYLPLSVSSTVFGMTFFNLHSLLEGFTLWAAVTVSLFLFSLVMLLWDRDYMSRIWYRFVLVQGKAITKDRKASVNF